MRGLKGKEKTCETPAYAAWQTPRRRGGAPLSSPPPTTDRRGTGWPRNRDTPPIDERPAPPRARPQRRGLQDPPPTQVFLLQRGPWGGAPRAGRASPPSPRGAPRSPSWQPPAACASRARVVLAGARGGQASATTVAGAATRGTARGASRVASRRRRRRRKQLAAARRRRRWPAGAPAADQPRAHADDQVGIVCWARTAYAQNRGTRRGVPRDWLRSRRAKDTGVWTRPPLGPLTLAGSHTQQ